MGDREDEGLYREILNARISRREVLVRASAMGLASLGLGRFLTGLGGGVRAFAASDAITVVHGSEPRSLNPPIDNVKTSLNIQLTMFDPLVGFDENLRIRPWLATDWKQISKTIWRFNLRQGVKFHNGEDMDAASVVATLKTYQEAKGQGTFFFTGIKEAREISKHTVDFVTEAPDVTIPTLMNILYILPKAYYSRVGPQEFSLHPVGTGPFQFGEWVKGDHITVKRNPNSWNGAPKLSQITFRWSPEAATRVAMLRSGQADLIVAVPAQLAVGLKAVGGRVEQINSMRKMFLEFNMNKPPFDDLQLRKAVTRAVNVDELVQTLVKGTGVRSCNILNRHLPSYNPNVTCYPYSPQEAKSLMSQAGYPNGFSFDFYHTVGRYPLDKEAATAIAGQLSKVGITAKLNGLETGAYFNLLTSNEMRGMHLLSITPTVPDEDIAMRIQFYSKGLFHYTTTPEIDRMVETAKGISDLTQRKAAYQALEKYMLEKVVPWVTLYDLVDFYGLSKRLHWKPRPDEIATFRDAFME